MKLLGIYSSAPQSGKSTLAKVLMENLDFKTRKISRDLKIMCNEFIKENTKNDPSWIDGENKDVVIPDLTTNQIKSRISNVLYLFTETVYVDQDYNPVLVEHIEESLHSVFLPVLDRITPDGITSRSIQRVLGLEWGQGVYGSGFWTRPIEEELKTIDHNLIIDDIRFEQDYNLIKNNNGIMIRIKNNKDYQTKHKSEGLLNQFDFDYQIDNCGTLEKYKVKIELLKEELFPQ